MRCHATPGWARSRMPVRLSIRPSTSPRHRPIGQCRPLCQGQSLAKSTTTAAPKSTFIKPNPDIKHIRLNPGLYSTNCVDRNYPGLSKVPFQIVDKFDRWKQLQLEAKPLRDESARIRRLLAQSAYAAVEGVAPAEQDPLPDRDDLIEQARQVKTELEKIEVEEDELQSQIHQMGLSLPNLSSVHTPVGTEPVVIDQFNPVEGLGVGRTKTGVVRSHVQIGADLGLLDFAGAAVTSGWGWYFLQNEAALLEQGLIQYALDVAQQHGFRVVSPPSIVYGHVASAAGFQPRDQNGERQVYTVGLGRTTTTTPDTADSGESTDETGLVLAATAEIPLAGMRANTHLRPSDLPDKVVGVSRCFRAEAGARGVDTRGLYRVHEFTKVELFGWTMPDEDDSGVTASLSGTGTGHFAGARTSQSASVLESIVAVQRHMLQSLHLPFRVLEQPSADLGASASRKIDMEAFFPARARDGGSELAGFGEVSSASACGDYQARRLGTRVRASARPGDGVGAAVGSPPELVYVHTCNGTAAAIPRLIAALLENGWDEGRRAVWVPEVLRKYVGGRQWIGRDPDQVDDVDQ